MMLDPGNSSRSRMLFPALQVLSNELQSNDVNITEVNLSHGILYPDDSFDGHNHVTRHEVSSFNYQVGVLSEVLAKNTMVEKLQIYWDFMQHLTEESRHMLFHAIGKIPNLKHLYIFYGDSELAVTVIGRVIGATCNLETFEMNDVKLEGTPTDFTNFCIALKYCTLLRELSFYNVTLPLEKDLNDLMTALSTLPELQDIQIIQVDLVDSGLSKPSIHALGQMPRLKVFTLDALELHRDTVIGISQMLEANTSLRKVTLSGSHLDPACVVALAKAVENNSSLCELYLTFDSDDSASCVTIVNALTKNSSLEVLNLDGSNLVDPDCDVPMSNAIISNSILKAIRLVNNSLGPCPKIANSLYANVSIKELCLSNSGLDRDSGIAIATALTKNTTLEVLNLSNNEIGAMACIALANSLQMNKTIEKLYLDHCYRGDCTAIVSAMLDALEKNYVIRVISMDGMMARRDIVRKCIFYLQLNCSGRKRLLGNDSVTKGEWIEKLISVRNKFDHLSFWVRAKPSLLFESNNDKTPANKRFKLK